MEDSAPETTNPDAGAPEANTLVICPACQGEVQVTAGDTAQLVPCPLCGESFIVASHDGSTELAGHEPESAEETAQRRAQELDSTRIHFLSAGRRSAYRARSYAIVATGACLVGAAQLVFYTVRRLRSDGLTLRPISYILVVAAMLCAAWYFLGRTMDFHREATRRVDDNPAHPPDFSSLSDGSHMVKNLDQMK